MLHRKLADLKSRGIRYGTAVVAVAAAFGFSVALRAILSTTPASPYLAAVAMVAWVAGFGPAIVTSALSAIALNYSQADSFVLSLGPSDLIAAAVFLLVGFVISSLTAARKRAEASMTLGEARLAGIIGSAMDAIISVDERQRIVLFNGAAEAMFRCRAGDALGQPLGRFIPERFRRDHEEHVRRFGDSGVTARSMTSPGRLVGLRADGEEFPIEATISQVEASAQKIYTVILRDITERLSAEQALRGKEMRFRGLVDANIIGVVVSDLGGQIIDANDEYLRIVGYTHEDLAAGRIRWDRMTPPEYRGASARAIEQLKVNGVSAPFEKEYVRKDGSRVPVLIGIAAMDDARDRSVGFVLDLTDRRRTADILRFLAEASTVLAAADDPDGALRTIARVAVPGLADWCVIDLVGDGGVIRRVAIAHSDPAREKQAWRASARHPAHPGVAHGPGHVIASGEPEFVAEMRDEILAASADDSEHLAALRALGLVSYVSAPLIARGRTLGALTLATAESGRRFAETDLPIVEDVARRLALGLDNARLYSEAATARAVAEASGQHSKFLAEASAVLAASLNDEHALRRVAGLVVPFLADWCVIDLADEEDGPLRRVAVSHADPARAPLARRLQQEYPPDHRGPHTLRRVLESGSAEISHVGDTEVAARARDAEHQRLLAELGTRSILVVPLPARGRIGGAITLVRGDGRAGFDEADRVLAEDLAARVGLAVDNARLYREAQSAIRAKDDFLAIVSHELRTPLQSMFGWVRLLRTGSLDGATFERALEAIERNTRLQGQLINDLLDVSGIIRGKLRLDLRAVDLAPVIEAAADAIRPAADGKSIHVRLAAPPDVGKVWGDPARLQQVVVNLLANAVKFTPRDGTVDVALARDGHHALIIVRDTGRGIAPEFLPHIFDRFRQAESSTTRPHGGLGLGLAIVRHLVEMHRGTVQAESAGEGRGATFTVRLPLEVPGDAPSRPSRRGGDGRRSEPMPELTGLRVLLVDDEPDARDLLMTALQRFGADVTAVGSAADALDILRRAQPDVLVSDIGMPDKDGYAFIREVRALKPEDGGRVPAAALTAYARLEDRERALAAGFQIHVAKPVEPAHLAATVARLARRA